MLSAARRCQRLSGDECQMATEKVENSDAKVSRSSSAVPPASDHLNPVLAPDTRRLESTPAPDTRRPAPMLSRIRAALGRGDHEPNPLERLPRTYSEASIDDRISLFTAELCKVGGNVEPLVDRRSATTQIAEMLKARAATAVAVSNGVESLLPNAREYFAGQGFQVTPSLNEFQFDSSSGETPAEAYKRTLINIDAGVTTADYAIADTGTLVLVSGSEQHRLISLMPPLHICLLKQDSILPNLAELIYRVNDGPYSKTRPPLVMTFITGPSRTADIELTLTIGVHGPRELQVFICSQ